jgi:hypothetical protein
MFRKAIQFTTAFSVFAFLCISLVPKLKGTEEQLRISLPEVVITSPDESKITDYRKIPIPLVSSLGTSVVKVFEGEIALYKQGKYRYLKGDYRDAVESFEKLIINYPESPLSGSAYYWLVHTTGWGNPSFTLINWRRRWMAFAK